MAIWRGKTMNGSGGMKVHVEWEMFGGMDSHKKAAGAAVSLARKYLNDAHAGLSGKTYHELPDAVQDLLTKFFALGGTLSASDFTEIKNVVALTRAGLNSNDLKLKISNTAVTETATTTSYVSGYVKNYAANDTRSAKKPEWHTLTQGPNVGRQSGNIHVHRKALTDKNSQGVDTILHEATHRYAGTADFGESGYVDSSGLSRNFRAPGLTPTQALNNADSYASFIYLAGKFDEWSQ